MKLTRSRYLVGLSVAFAIYWIAWAIQPGYFKVWLTENTLSVALLILLIATHRRFPLSNISYTLIAFSMIYELIEWAYAVVEGGSAGQAFLGTQGDEWDTHKDMVLASIGALISMIVVAFINWRFDRHFGDEFRHSLRVKQFTPLGEVKLAELRHPLPPSQVANPTDML